MYRSKQARIGLIQGIGKDTWNLIGSCCIGIRLQLVSRLRLCQQHCQAETSWSVKS